MEITIDITELLELGYSEKELRQSIVYWMLQKKMDKNFDGRFVEAETKEDEPNRN